MAGRVYLSSALHSKISRKTRPYSRQKLYTTKATGHDMIVGKF